MEIVINNCFGGFGLSAEAETAYLKAKGKAEPVWVHDIPRHDSDLIAIVRGMGKAADGAYASLKIVEIPDGVDYEIAAYDGNEHIAEKHSTWG